VQKAYAKAKLNLLEAKANPYRVKRVNENENIYIMNSLNEEQSHSAVVKESVAQSLIITRSKAWCKYLKSNSILAIFISIITLDLVIIVSHPMIPWFDHLIERNGSFIVIPWQINCIRISYIVLSGIFYSMLILMMTIGVGNYFLILQGLRRLLSSTELMRNTDLETPYFLNIREPENLEYFLSLFRPIQRNIDSYHIFLSTMACALVIDIILIITSVIHVFIENHSTDLLTVWCLLDISILSIFIIIFLAIVVLINKLSMYDLIQHLKNLKKSMLAPSSQQRNHNDTIRYLDAVIDHMESASREYAVKLFGLIIDQKFVVRIIISIASGIASNIVAFIRHR
jgi:hypothetical protein